MDLKKMNVKLNNNNKNKGNSNNKGNISKIGKAVSSSLNNAVNNFANNKVNNSSVETLFLDSTNNTSNDVVNNGSKKNIANVKINNVFKYFHNSDEGSMQGYTMTDKYHVMIQTNEKKHNARLIFIDKVTGKSFAVNIDEDCGHANDMEYNPKRNELIIPYEESKTKKSAVKVIKLNEKDSKGNFKIATKYMPFSSGKISYDANEDAYYVAGDSNAGIGVIRKIDANTLEMDKEYGDKLYKTAYKFGDKYLSQGMTIKNDKIYLVANKRGDWESYIFEYDKNGNLLSQAIIPYSEGHGELESIKFDENNQLYGNIVTKDKGTLGHGKNTRIVKIAYNPIGNNDNFNV